MTPSSSSCPAGARAERSAPLLAIRGVCAAGVVAALVFAGSPAAAFKWKECPQPPVPLNGSKVGGTQGPFIHPGHELRIILNQREIAATGGGFSIAPDGNTVEVSFRSLFGEPVVLAPRTATAVSSAVLAFPFPDPAAEIGRDLAGPVEVRVRSGDRQAAWIAADDLVALPPVNDVTELVAGAGGVEAVRAALSARGDVWIPVRFDSGPGMSMPGCEGNFVMKTPIYVSGAATQGAIFRGRDPLQRIRRIRGYIGDMTINDADFYGLYFPEHIRPVHMAGMLGVSICRMNDAADLVLRLQGARAWARSKRSPMRDAVAGSAPLSLQLRAAAKVPARIDRSGQPIDTFGNVCEPAAPNAAGKGSPR
jgi:hypothetical protein